MNWLGPLLLVPLLLACGRGPGRPEFCAGPPNPDSRLILHDWFGEGPVPTPGYIRKHRDFLDSGLFDGVAVYVRTEDQALNVSATVLGDTLVDHRAIAKTLAPLKGLGFKNLTENFAAVLGGRPPDFSADWSVPIANFAGLAKAARDAGLRGIYFDNESYGHPWADYPRGVLHPEKPLREYQDLARLRGRQVMAAMVQDFPDITVIMLHGPYLSEPKAPAGLFPQWQKANELLGPFFAGFVEGAGASAAVVDGGELYHLRSEEEFHESKNWRKQVLPSPETDCAFLPQALREAWPGKVSIGFGLIDKKFGGQPMDPDVLAPTLTAALRQADRYVWLYVEGASFLCPPSAGGADERWQDAVRRGRAGARKVPGH